jgi:hypothetical protein
MSNLPKFITFTGADDQTSIEGMCELSAQYPIEWGILFSPKRQGEGRYPPMRFIERLVGGKSLEFSAHLCGGDSRSVIESRESQHDDLISEYFARSQINTSDPKADPFSIALWSNRLGITPIMQCRDAFPNDMHVAWLFDASGGRGIAPAAWPESRGIVLRGYAGGLNPENVAAAVDSIGEIVENYWIDMETGVRDYNDRFSLDKCRQVCEAVFAKEPSNA